MPDDPLFAALEEIREREQRATPGPWAWFGNTDVRDICLATKHFGRTFVMRFARWGMSGATPVFYPGRTWKGDPADPEFTHGGLATKAADMAVYEVAPQAETRDDPRVYRADLAGIRHPDAEFIAHAREDVRLLLAVVDKVLAAHRNAGGRCAWCRNPDGQRQKWPCGEYLAITRALTREADHAAT